MSVEVRYWAAARAAAGLDSEVVSASSVGQLVDTVIRRRPANQEFTRVLSMSSLLVNGVTAGPVPSGGNTQVSPGDVVDILPPFAGG